MQRTEIKLISFGAVDQNVLDYLTLTITAVFNVPCESVRAAIDTADAFDPVRRQYNSIRLLTKLLDLNVRKGCKVLGITDVDLFIPVLTFVFGQAQLGGRVALISLHRLHPEFYGLPEDLKLFYSRCEKEANHELGHTSGLAHCHSYDCVMHVSNSIEQVDLKPGSFCRSCEVRLCAANQFPGFAGFSDLSLRS
jgi:archaemetzincin